MAFIVTKKLELDFLGEGWQGAYLNFSIPGMKEGINQPNPPTEAELRADAKLAKKYGQELIDNLKLHFLGGQGWNGSQLVAISKDQIDELPTSVFIAASKLLSGVPDPK